MLLLLFYLLVSGALDVSDLEPYSADLDNIAFHESMAFDLLSGVIAIFYYFPEHSLRVFEKILFLNIV